MERNLLRYGIVLLFVASVMGVFLPVYEFRYTAGGEPVETERASDDYLASTDLSRECRRIARRLAAERTVLEEGVRFSAVGRRVLVKRSTVAGGWHRSDVICLDRLSSREAFRTDGQYYRVDWRSVHRRRIGWLETVWVVVGLAGIGLCYLGATDWSEP